MTRSMPSWQTLQGRIAGKVVLSGSPAYQELPKPFNARFHDVRPQAVVRCATPQDVAETISFARRHGLACATRNGGHCFAGCSVTRGLVIDVTPMRLISVSGGVAAVGAQLGAVYESLERQLGQTGWCPDYVGDNARQTISLQYDGRIDPAVSGNFSEYHNPDVNRLIDRALAEPDRDPRAALWGQIDQRIMRDAPLVPLIWENHSFHWASRVHGWLYDPWTATTDLTAVWLDPPNP